MLPWRASDGDCVGSMLAVRERDALAARGETSVPRAATGEPPSSRMDAGRDSVVAAGETYTATLPSSSGGSLTCSRAVCGARNDAVRVMKLSDRVASPAVTSTDDRRADSGFSVVRRREDAPVDSTARRREEAPVPSTASRKEDDDAAASVGSRLLDCDAAASIGSRRVDADDTGFSTTTVSRRLDDADMGPPASSRRVDDMDEVRSSRRADALRLRLPPSRLPPGEGADRRDGVKPATSPVRTDDAER